MDVLAAGRPRSLCLPLLVLALLTLPPGLPRAAADTLTPSAPLAAWVQSGSAAYDGQHVYFFGGERGAEWANRDSQRGILRFDPANGASQLMGAQLPDQSVYTSAVWDPRDLPAQGCPGGCAYVFGGRIASDYAGYVSSDIVRYNPATDAAQVVGEHLPGPRSETAAVWDPRDLPAQGCPGGCAYVFGGWFDHQALSDIVRYNPTTGRATLLPMRLPLPARAPSAVWAGDVAYVFGGGGLGRNGWESHGAIVRFDPVLGLAALLPPGLPGERELTGAAWDPRDLPAEGCPGGCAYLFGGVHKWFQNLGGGSGIYRREVVRDVVRFHPLLGARLLTLELPFPAEAASAVWVGEAGYVGLRDRVGAFDPLLPGRPSEPRSLAAHRGPGDGQVALTWTAPRHTDGALQGYRVYRAAPGEPPLLHATLDGSAAGFTDAGIPRGEARAYWVSAVNAVGEGPLAGPAEARAPTLPGAPELLLAVPGPLPATVALHWPEARDDGGIPILHYNVYRELPEGAVRVGQPEHPPFLDAGLAPGQAVGYHVTAVNAVGEGAASPSSRAEAPLLPLPPRETEMLLRAQGFSPPSVTIPTGGIVAFKHRGAFEPHNPGDAAGTVGYYGRPGRGACFDFRADQGRDMMLGEEYRLAFWYDPPSQRVWVSRDLGLSYAPCPAAVSVTSGRDAVVAIRDLAQGFSGAIRVQS